MIEHNVPGKPHQGKVLACIQAHSDDIPLYAGGTVAKLVDEGYTAYLIRISNDEAAGKTLGYGVVQNEIDNQAVAQALGCKKAFSFYYRNHRMDDCDKSKSARGSSSFPGPPGDDHCDGPITITRKIPIIWLPAARLKRLRDGWRPQGLPGTLQGRAQAGAIREKSYHARSPQGHNLVNRIVTSVPTSTTRHVATWLTAAKARLAAPVRGSVTSWRNEARSYHCSVTTKTRQTSSTSSIS